MFTQGKSLSILESIVINKGPVDKGHLCPVSEKSRGVDPQDPLVARLYLWLN